MPQNRTATMPTNTIHMYFTTFIVSSTKTDLTVTFNHFTVLQLYISQVKNRTYVKQKEAKDDFNKTGEDLSHKPFKILLTMFRDDKQIHNQNETLRQEPHYVQYRAAGIKNHTLIQS